MREQLFFAFLAILTVSISYNLFNLVRFNAHRQSIRSTYHAAPLPTQRELLSTNVTLATPPPLLLAPRPTTTAPTTSSAILNLHIRVHRLNPKDYMVDITPPSLSDIIILHNNSVPNYVFTHFPASLIPNTSTILPALPYYHKTFYHYQYNPRLQVVELKVNRSLLSPTEPLDLMLVNETRCMGSLRLSAQNSASQMLRGAYRTISGPCAPCLITLRHSSSDRTIFSFLKVNNYTHVFGKDYRPYAGAVDDNYFFVKLSLPRCESLKYLFNMI